ncbi:bifunctional hydroxymethylpyrimidine kinase/phosphomethylpyrimidine kinase [Pseudodesulfovibrio sp. zrk46]|uniref:bifunctional hydroxymethylpyrimidine kinase/phosphomethylpyrimidine kinase n=1 Tax=Pseudodesulfovibrio sp. zrk46 TaxID=2725288 RepID=UPI001449AC20|nr:bifunctional hydroxymethylpyrimidine kinase/phosphomethylpyrimidine kinase [Pseudodesulfovibrio sp. zrk46]QJB57907.1 bifunctional hydroxymethylpyrimidine kinase/phosphomethylpyrimidine kinase [Pseudodesulfovibrio sp. zrk46]
MEKLSCILTIAGSDSGGGAGIQADLKTVTMLGGYGASVITALTAQNTKAVTGIHAPSAKFVVQQLKTVLDDIDVSAAKTGMLFSEPIIKAIAPVLSKKTFPLVVDPVCVATSGAKLLKDDAVEAIVRMIFPYADLLTPNIPEAELFSGVKINDREDVFKAARILLDMGPQAVLIKGGHADSWAITDWFVRKDGEPVPFIQQRVSTNCTHGTGCTLSAAIATGLGQGMEMGAAIKRAQDYLNLALRGGYQLGDGGGPPNHLAPWIKANGRDGILSELDAFGRWLVAKEAIASLMPRGRSNVAVALPLVDNIDEVAGFTGGFVRTRRGDVLVSGHPEFGASEKTAATLLGVTRLNSDVGCAITLGVGKYTKQTLDAVGLDSVWIDRDRKPDYIQEKNGQFAEWGVFEELKGHVNSEAVRAVGDPGGLGIEPVVHLLASNLGEMRDLLARYAESYKEIEGQ